MINLLFIRLKKPYGIIYTLNSMRPKVHPNNSMNVDMITADIYHQYTHSKCCQGFSYI